MRHVLPEPELPMTANAAGLERVGEEDIVNTTDILVAHRAPANRSKIGSDVEKSSGRSARAFSLRSPELSMRL